MWYGPSVDRRANNGYRRDDAARRAEDLILSLMTDRAQDMRDSLPPEFELIRLSGEGRNATRQALAKLQAAGLLKRERGVGTTTVSGWERHRMDRMLSIVEGPGEERERIVSGKNVLIEQKIAPDIVRRRLDLPEGAEVVYTERVITVDGSPVSLRGSWLSAELAERLTIRELAMDHVDLLENCIGIEVGRTSLEIIPALADERVAELLHMPVGAPLIHTTRVIHNRDGQPVEFGASRNRGDRISIVVNLER